MKIKSLKQIGIIVSYIWLLVAVYFFEWKPIGIFLSFLAEFTILLFTYWFLNIFSTRKNKRNRPGGNVLLAGCSLILLQYVLIGLIANFLGEKSFNFGNPASLFDTNSIIAITSISVIYLIRLFFVKQKDERESYAQENLLTQALCLTGMIVLGFFVIQILEISNAIPVLAAMVAGRIFLEQYINNWNRKIA